MINKSLTAIKKVIFINPYPYYAHGINEATIYPPLGITYLAAVLEKHNVECKIIDAAVLRLDITQVYQQVKAFKPDLIGITTNIVTARAAMELGKYLRRKLPKAFIIFGGPYATAESETVLHRTKADLVVYGEGELTILDLLQNFRNLPAIKGICYRRGAKIFHNGQRELIMDLDSVPFPAYHLLPDFSHYKSRSRKVPLGFLISSRGCPYNCIYCNKNIFGKRFRMRSPANVLTEIELLVGRYKVKQIDILDDNFTLYLPRAEKIFDEILKRKIKVLFNFQNGIRADRLTPQLVKKMKQAGVYKVGIGVESGDREIQKIIKKSLKLSRVVRATKMLRKAGIVVVCFFMIGLPGETGNSLQKTIDFAIRVDPHIANFSVVVPLPQTELYEMIEKEGKFLKPVNLGSSTGFYSDQFSYEIGEVNQKLVRTYVSKAYKKFYLRPRKIIDILFSIRSLEELRWIHDTTRPLVKFLCS